MPSGAYDEQRKLSSIENVYDGVAKPDGLSGSLKDPDSRYMLSYNG